jgi:hypothetical protein
MAIKDVTSTSFGLVIAYLLPGVVALFSLSFWYSSARDAFHTFLTSKSNLGLFLFLLLGALTLGLVISTVRWLVYERLLSPLCGRRPTDDEWRRMSEENRFVAFRAAVDETLRYHQCFGGLTIAAPALFFGWLNSLDAHGAQRAVLIVAFGALEGILAVSSVAAFRRYLKFVRAILGSTSSPATRRGFVHAQWMEE